MTAEQIIQVLEENYSFKITSKGKVIAEKDFPKIAREILALMPSEKEIKKNNPYKKNTYANAEWADGANFVKNFKRT